MKRSLPLILGFILLGFSAFIPKMQDPLELLIASLKLWQTEHPQEKVYLHMDKPYYALGDTIWFKGYVTVGSRHQLSALSGGNGPKVPTCHIRGLVRRPVLWANTMASLWSTKRF